MNKAQRSFARGELAPALHARTDTTGYEIGLKTCRNYMVMRQGGVTKRPGTEYIGPIRDMTKRARLIPFVFNVRDSLVLEFGPLTVRFIQDGGFVADPDDDSEIYEIVSPYTEAELPELQYVQSADVVTIVHPSHPPYELQRFANNNWTLTPITFGAAIAKPTGVVATGTNFHASRDCTYVITAVSDTGEESLASDPSTAHNPPTEVFPVTIAGTATGATTYNVYRSDAGSGVYGFIGSGVGSTIDFADRGQLPDYTIQPPVEKLPFAAAGDYPSVVAYYQQRLVFANTNNKPDTVWCSRTGHFHNFNVSVIVQDDDAITFRLQSDEVDAIRHIVNLGRLIVLTEGVSWVIEGDGNGVITPIAINARAVSYDGSSHLRPIKAGARLIFAQALGAAVRELSASSQFGAFNVAGGDLTIYSTHLVDGYALDDWGFQQEPAHVVWAVRSDGVMLGLTYLPEQEEYAWTRHDTKGFIENVCVVPEGKTHWVYWCVKRLINGTYRRYIERQTVSAVVPVFATVDELAATPGGIITPAPPPSTPPPSGGPLAPPTNASTTGIGTEGATANWVPGNTLAPVEFSYRPQGAADTAWHTTTLAGGTTSFGMVALTAGTAYEWRARQVIGTQFSDYVGPSPATQFTTLSATQTLAAPSTAPAVTNTTQLSGESDITVEWPAPAVGSGISSKLQIAGPINVSPSDGDFTTVSSFAPGVGLTVLPIFASGFYYLRVRYEKAGFAASPWAGPTQAVITVINETGTPGGGGGSGTSSLFDGFSELPRIYLDTRVAATPSAGSVVSLGLGATAADFQNALNAALPGDVIKLARGLHLEGNFVLPTQSAGGIAGGWVTVTINQSPSFLAEGTRLTPTDAATYNLPRLRTPNLNPVLSTTGSSNCRRWRFIGIELDVNSVVTTMGGIVLLGDGSSAQNAYSKIPQEFIFDRCYAHGFVGLDCRRAFKFDGAACALIDSTVDQITSAFDCQAVASSNGPGPYRIHNNYLAAATENIAFGGGTLWITDMNPSDVEITKNHLWKDPTWKDSTVGGQAIAVKNCIEFKSMVRALIEGNVLENANAGNFAGLSFWSVSQAATGASDWNPWVRCEDITVRYNTITKCVWGVNLTDRYNQDQVRQPNGLQRVTLKHNVFRGIGEGMGGSIRVFAVNGPMDGIWIEHNTAFCGDAWVVWDAGAVQTRHIVKNNLGMGLVDASTGQMSAAWNVIAGTGSIVRRNVWAGYTLGWLYPVMPDNATPALADVGLVGNIADVFSSTVAITDLALGNTSAFKGYADDGTDPGADITAVTAAIAGVAP